MAFVPGTQFDDILIPTANGGDYRGGAGNDTYIITKATSANGVIQITDTEGTNTVQLADGLTVTASSFLNNAVELTLSNGSKVQVVGASSFKFEVGANATAGDTADAPQQTYAQFGTALGVTIPAAGAPAVAGTPNYVVPTTGVAPAPVFSVTGAAAAAEGTNASFTVALANRVAGTAYGVTVALTGSGGATAGTDFANTLTLDAASIAAGITLVGGVLTVPAASSVSSVTLTSAVTADSLSPETGEGLTVTLSAPTGTGATINATKTAATTTITDVPVTYTLTASASSVFENAPITYTVTASANVSADTVVSFTVVPGDVAAANAGTSNTNLADFAAGSFNPANVTMLAGTKTATFIVTGLDDSITELPENYKVTATVNGTTLTQTTSLLDGTNLQGQTFNLTAGADIFTGAGGNDTFNGGTSGSFSAFDTLDGGSGSDTLTALLTTTTAPAGVSVKNTETVTFNTTASGFTVDTTGYTGLTKLNVTSAGTTGGHGAIGITAAATTAATISGAENNAVTVVGTGGALSISTGAAAVVVGGTAVANALDSVSVTGGTTVAITDRSGAAAATGSQLKTVSATGNTGNVTVTADGLTTLNLTKQVTAATVNTVTAAAGTRALTVNVNGVDDSADGAATGGTITVTDAEATSLAINGVTAKSWDLTFNAAKATAVTIDTAVGVQLDALTAGKAATVGISGAGAVTVSAHTLDAAAVITSTNTGGVTFTGALLAGQRFVGTSSSGADTLTLSASGTTASSSGAGNDSITYAGAMGTGGSFDAGDGTDTLTMTAAQAVTATGSTAFAPTVSNFEVLRLSAATGAAAAINMANADGINHLNIAGATVGALTVTNAAADFTLTQRALTSFASSIALASDVGTSDNVNLVYSAADGFTSTAAITIANVESLKITTKDADTTAQTAVIVTPLTATSASSVTVSGDMGISFIGGMTQTTLTSLDASGLTASGAFGGLTWTAGALAASSVIKGSAAGTNTVIFSAANTAGTFVTYTGGTGADNITGSNGLNNVVNLGNGTNSFTSAGAGNNTITGGTGADTVSVGTGGNTITTGAGNDVINIGASTKLNSVNVGTDTDRVNLTGIQSAAGFYTTVTGMGGGDIIDVSAVIGTAAAVSAQTSLGAAIVLGGAASFANYLDAAAAGDGNTANTILKWFQFGGNTFIVEDTSAAATFQDGFDTVISLAGLVDVSTATVASGVITLAGTPT